MSEFYVAVIETNSEGEFFVSVPDLPGVNAAATTRLAALELAVEFANDYVRDLVEDGHAVPPARDLAEIEHDLEAREAGRALIPVEVPGRSLKISLSIDQALLARADRAAANVGLTRSGFFAAAVEEKIRESAPSSRGRRLSPTGFAEQGRTFGYLHYPAEFVPARQVGGSGATSGLHVVPNPKGGWDVVRGKEVVSHAPAPEGKGRRRRVSPRKGT
jgi:predicted RNase H-like HicB family nuclease